MKASRLLSPVASTDRSQVSCKIAACASTGHWPKIGDLDEIRLLITVLEDSSARYELRGGMGELMFSLLSAERGVADLIGLGPPDRGVDILHRHSAEAFQCKASEGGASKSLSAESSLDSLSMAIGHRNGIGWQKYSFATNARYTGAAYSSVRTSAQDLGLDDKTELGFLGPEYWDELCDKHYERVKNRMDYRISVDEKQIVEAFRQARFLDRYVSAYTEKIQQAKYSIVVANNRTPVELEFPFSPDLTVENCLDVAKEIMGISSEWTSFADLDTSAGPSVSLTVNGYAQGFSKKLLEIGLKRGDKLQLWIKLIWQDGAKEDSTPSTDNRYMALRTFSYRHLRRSIERTERTPRDRATETVGRKEDLIQAMIWSSVARLNATGHQSV